MKIVKLMDVQEWDALVIGTYDKPYSFQQQDDCKPRGICQVTVPVKSPYDYENTTVPEEVNHEDMGVSFKAWLERDPRVHSFKNDWENCLWWDRNFYPCVDMLVNDLHEKGLLEAGDYVINIDW